MCTLTQASHWAQRWKEVFISDPVTQEMKVCFSWEENKNFQTEAFKKCLGLHLYKNLCFKHKLNTKVVNVTLEINE